MSGPLRLCNIADLDQDRPRCYRMEGVDIFIVRHGETIYALENRCGHAGAALHRGVFTDGLIVCPLHGAAFRVEDGTVEWDAIIPPPMSEYAHSDNPRLREFGELLEGIETLPIRTFVVQVINAEVFVVRNLSATNTNNQISSMP